MDCEADIWAQTLKTALLKAVCARISELPGLFLLPLSSASLETHPELSLFPQLMCFHSAQMSSISYLTIAVPFSVALDNLPMLVTVSYHYCQPHEPHHCPFNIHTHFWRMASFYCSYDGTTFAWSVLLFLYSLWSLLQCPLIRDDLPDLLHVVAPISLHFFSCSLFSLEHLLPCDLFNIYLLFPMSSAIVWTPWEHNFLHFSIPSA